MHRTYRFTLAAVLVAAGAGAAGAQDAVGIAACDDFLSKYEGCVTTKVPEAQRATLTASISQMRAAWKPMATNPQTKGALESACQQSAAQIKQATSAYGCQW